MKKQLLLLVVMMLLSLAASAEVVEIDGIYYNLVSKIKEASVAPNTNGSYVGDIVIPSTVTYNETTYTVTTIGNMAFEWCDKIKSITIPSSIKVIERAAFYQCHNIDIVKIENISAWCKISYPQFFESNPLQFANHLYLDNQEITNLVIPGNATSVNDYAFYGCRSLASVIFDEGVESIGNHSFWGCNNLTSVNFSQSVEKIGEYAFADCGYLSSLSFPASMKIIDSGTFCRCSSLTNIVLPDGIEFIEGTFTECKNLSSVVIPQSCRSIGSHTFRDCSKLININIPQLVEWIGNYAFEGCSGLTSIVLPNKVESIGEYAFEGCSGVKSLVIGSSIYDIADEAFANCKDLQDVYCYAEQIPQTKSNVFKNSYIEYATLHVPDASIDNYRMEYPWMNFKEIIALTDSDLSGINEHTIDDAKVSKIYTLDGKPLSEPKKGLNIMKMSNGKTKKVIVK